MKILVSILLAVLCARIAVAGQTLDVYDIDVEGGKAVLIVSPSGESLLYDVGWPGNDGRDTDRIVTAAKAAGLRQIDYLVISHYDIDHLGDVPLLVSKFPVKHIIDHGPMEASGKTPTPQYRAYAAVRDRMDHLAVKAGDHLPISGVDVLVVTAAGKHLDRPLPDAGSPQSSLCHDAAGSRASHRCRGQHVDGPPVQFR